MFIPHMSLLQRRSIFTTRGSQLLLVTTVTTILTSTSQFCIFQPVQGFLSSLGSNRIVEYQRYHSSSSNNNNNDVDVDETDLTRWDQLYQQGSVYVETFVCACMCANIECLNCYILNLLSATDSFDYAPLLCYELIQNSTRIVVAIALRKL